MIAVPPRGAVAAARARRRAGVPRPGRHRDLFRPRRLRRRRSRLLQIQHREVRSARGETARPAELRENGRVLVGAGERPVAEPLRPVSGGAGHAAGSNQTRLRRVVRSLTLSVATAASATARKSSLSLAALCFLLASVCARGAVDFSEAPDRGRGKWVIN
jgi:hypothetical protein